MDQCGHYYWICSAMLLSLTLSATYLQEHARDSFENLLFSLCRFHALTGHYPERLLLVSYEFKHERFAGLHAKALRWPTTRLDFLGTPALTPAALEVNCITS